MIKKLSRKFISLSMVALLTLLVVIVAGMNLINYNTVVAEADQVLAILTDNDGKFPQMSGDFKGEHGSFKGEHGGRPMSPEVPFESRHFTVQFDDAGGVVFADVAQIAAIDADTAITYGEKVLAGQRANGFLGNFRYAKNTDNRGTRVTFLDCGRKLEAFYSFMWTSLLVSLLGYLVISLFIVFFAGKILKPVAQSYEKQKRFITDAGHEMKTPLTIISANADVLMMEQGENDCLRDIKQQTNRLAALTNELVYLSRMEEENPLHMIEFPISDLVCETAQAFVPVAQAAGKEIVTDIQPMLTMNGDAQSMEKLVSIVMSNAVKYAPAGSRISLQLRQKGKQLLLTVENPVGNTILPEETDAVFDRFYRADASRDSQTGGHGIGLSIAKAIVNAHGGKISAWTKNGSTFGITASFSAGTNL